TLISYTPPPLLTGGVRTPREPDPVTAQETTAMISAETASRPPPCALFKTWGSQLLVPFVNASGKGKTAVAGAEGASTRNPACGDDSGLDQVREKLSVHLREAADRMNLVVPSSPPPPQQPKDGRTWNLRARRGRPRVPTEIEHHLGGSPSPAVEKRAARARPAESDRPRFSISLSREEIEEDIYAVTGCRARRRPRKRPRVIQKQLDVSLLTSCPHRFSLPLHPKTLVCQKSLDLISFRGFDSYGILLRLLIRVSVSRRMAVGGLPPTRIGFRSSLSGEVSTPAVT
ncbi:hypothetical protein BHE74_00041089, partial [Ensete ventricosum]